MTSHVALLVRSTRALSMTEAGVQLMERAQPLRDQLADAHAEVAAVEGAVAGTLRLACYPTFGKRYVIPALEAVMRERPELQVELDLTERLADPVLERLDAAMTVSYGSNSVTKGNPALGPTTGDNFDGSIEYYVPHGGKATVAVFDKEFHNYIVPQQVFSSYPGIQGVAAIQTFSSVKSAQAYGAEADYAQQLTFLPGFLKNFGVEANYTWINSSMNIHPGKSTTLPSSSKNNANVAIYYDNGRFSFRVAGNYLSRNLYSIGGSAETDVYTAPQFRLDLGTTFAITKKITAYLDVKNLTNQPLKYTEGTTNSRTIQQEFYYQTVMGGIRASF